MKWLVLLLAFGLSGCSDSLIESYCLMRLNPPTLAVHLEQEGYVVGHTEPSTALGARLSAAERAQPGRVVGLTTGRFEQNLDYALAGVPGLGFVCVQPQVGATLTLKAQRVDVAREVPEASCRYRETLEHELLHVQAYRAHLLTTAEDLKQAFAERYPPRLLYSPGGWPGCRCVAGI